jgi:hypothetical protein
LLGKYSTHELPSLPMLFFFFETGSHPRLTLAIFLPPPPRVVGMQAGTTMPLSFPWLLSSTPQEYSISTQGRTLIPGIFPASDPPCIHTELCATHRYSHIHKAHIFPLSAPESHWCYEIQTKESNYSCLGEYNQSWGQAKVGTLQVELETQEGWGG